MADTFFPKHFSVLHSPAPIQQLFV